MGYAEKLVYCKNNKDTQKLYKMLRNAKSNTYEIVAKSTLQTSWTMEWQNLRGLRILGYEIPFNFPTLTEIENPNAFYKTANNFTLPNHIAKKIAHTKPEQLKKEVMYEDLQEQTFEKGDNFIWIAGNRGNMKDGYSLMGFDELAIIALLDSYKKHTLDDCFLKDGKINLDVALPKACDEIATLLLGEEKARILREAKFIDIDGFENPSLILDDILKHSYEK